ncbi:methyltransferase domain-containing protein [Aquibacillus halophilus]|uniref:Methyltransferase domain-containing protein n=1 Tax=Aquibacillus halophilus TaxID=930132 RepID=A0A6A8D6X7_9BACI|nr:class I SAM-dependent methyltransferase [Aquibacillus halophilus]MRH41338.1 methyltransferase domain-containing protein [Aquibacillus halophilus]
MNSFDWHKEAKEQWDQKTNFWNQSSQGMWETGSRKTIIPFVKKHIPHGSYIADLGCGDGYGSYKLLQAGYRVVGLDLSEEMIERAKSKQGNEEITFTVGDLTNLPFDNEVFSGLMAINSIEWTEHPLKALNEMKRVVKKDHLLCLGLLGPTAAPRANSYQRLYGNSVICNTLMPWEFEQLAQENGWEVVGGRGIYKQGVSEKEISHLSIDLKQALTFMWLFILRKL